MTFLGTFPATPADLTPEWLTATLPGNVTITAVEADDIGEGTGIFGEIARLSLTSENDSAPATMIAKMPCTEPANLAVAQALGLYERELNMFDHVLDESPIRAPERYAAARGDDGAYVLLMEDLSDEFNVGDQIVGATLTEAEAIVDALADLHARWWGDEALDSFDWLPKPNAPVYQAAVPGIYAAGLPILQSEWTDRVPGAAIDVATRVGDDFLALMNRTAEGPQTLIHTDTRLDNIFFAKDGSGDVAFIDFQLALAGRGAADISYLIGTSVPQELAAEHWERLLRRWHDRLTGHGVSYSFDDAVLHYREATLYYLSGAMSLIGSFDTGNARGAAMANAYCTRILHHAVDTRANTVL